MHTGKQKPGNKSQRQSAAFCIQFFGKAPVGKGNLNPSLYFFLIGVIFRINAGYLWAQLLFFSLKSIQFPVCAFQCQLIHRSASNRGFWGLCKHRAKPNVAFPVEKDKNFYLQWLEIKSFCGFWYQRGWDQAGEVWSSLEKSHQVPKSHVGFQDPPEMPRLGWRRAKQPAGFRQSQKFHALRGRAR